MTQNFSKNLSRLLRNGANETAKEYHAAMVEPEHVLLALLEKKIGFAFEILLKLTIDVPRLELQLKDEITQKSVQAKTAAEASDMNKILSFSLRLQEGINIANLKAKFLGFPTTGTEHLLYALSIEKICPIFAAFLRNSDKSAENIENLIKVNMAENILKMRGTRQRGDSSVLNEFGINLNEKERAGFLDPIIGRENETERIIQILCRRTKNNPVLVGEAGVGKTAIVEGLVAKINAGMVPRALLNKRIISIEVGALLAGTKYRGQFEERIKRIIEESIEDKNLILFIDEVHTLIGGGNVGQNSLDAADLLKPALARGEIQCIGATTHEEYRRSIEKDAGLERRFQKVLVSEPSIEETIEILNGIKSKYEVFHNVEYTADAIVTAANLSARYINDRFLPDKAIDVLDEAGAAKKIQLDKKPEDLNVLEKTIESLNEQKDEFVQSQNYEAAAKLRDEVKLTQEKLHALKLAWENPQYVSLGYVDEKQIEKTVSMITKVPLEELSVEETKRLIAMPSTLKSEVIGQDEAIDMISHAIQRSRAGISSPDRPIASFLFLGPTGVGKTLLAKKLAKFLFGKEDALIRIDMSDFMEKHNISRLVGAPPGYIGFENGGTLTEQVRKNQYSVILFDEIEKAHRDVFNLLLQVLEEGELDDNFGHTVSFRNTLIIMTSNAGSRSIINERQLGFSMAERGVMDYRTIKQNAESEIKEFLSPEFINRLDDIVVFAPLDKKAVKKIFDIELSKLNERLAAKNIKVLCTERGLNYFIENGYEPSYGARPMRRLIQNEIENRLAELFLNAELSQNATVEIDMKNGELKFNKINHYSIVQKTEKVLSEKNLP